MGCPCSQEVIHPNQSLQQSEKQNRKAKIMNSKTNSDKGIGSQKSRSHITTENIIQVRQPINGEGLILVQKAISNHFLFYGLNHTERYQLIKLMRRYSALKNQYIFKKGDEASTFFIICSGKVEIQTGLQTPKFLQKGECFGELALIYLAPRSVSVIARQETVLWGIQNSIFNRYMMRVKQKNYNLIRSFIDKLPFFAFMNGKEKQNLVTSCHRFKYVAGSKVFNIKDPANSIFVVMEGRIQMQIPNKPKVLFEKGEMFGEGCLLGDQFRSGTAWSIEQTECLSISKNSLLKELGIETDNILFYCICKWALKRCSRFQLLKRTIIDKIIFTGEMKIVEDGQVIQAKGVPSNMLFICLEGRINNGGIGSIFNQHDYESGSKNLIKNQRGFVFMIGFNTLTKIINRPLKTYVQAKERKIKIRTQHLGSIDDFVILAKIKETSINELLEVTTHTNKSIKYLVDCLKKNTIIETKQEIQVHQFLRTFQKIRQHSLIPKIIRIFSNDPDYLFVVKQFTGVISLADLIDQIKLTQKDLKFYIASIVQIVSHLHSQNIMHRNINPDSFIVSSDGYLYADELKKIRQTEEFIIFDETVSERTKTIISLPQYAAPQVISGDKHTIISDLWSVGILIYQIIYGRVPFGCESNDVMDIYAQILQNNLILSATDSESQQQNSITQIITNLLKIQQKDRIELSQVKLMAYFTGFQFEKLRCLNMQAPDIKLKKSVKNEQSKIFPTRLMNDINQYFAAERKFLGEPLTSNKMPNWANFSD